MNKYDLQAEAFLSSTGTSFEISFLYTAPYFEGDEEPRDVYRFTLRNHRGAYSGTFGDSLQNTWNRKGKPSAYMVLASLSLDANCPISFEEFCNEFGYDTDSRTAERIHRACLEQRAGLERIFTPAELKQLEEIV